MIQSNSATSTGSHVDVAEIVGLMSYRWNRWQEQRGIKSCARRGTTWWTRWQSDWCDAQGRSLRRVRLAMQPNEFIK
jgi:hypothetical protein